MYSLLAARSTGGSGRDTKVKPIVRLNSISQGVTSTHEVPPCQRNSPPPLPRTSVLLQSTDAPVGVTRSLQCVRGGSSSGKCCSGAASRHSTRQNCITHNERVEWGNGLVRTRIALDRGGHANDRSRTGGVISWALIQCNSLGSTWYTGATMVSVQVQDERTTAHANDRTTTNRIAQGHTPNDSAQWFRHRLILANSPFIFRSPKALRLTSTSAPTMRTSSSTLITLSCQRRKRSV